MALPRAVREQAERAEAAHLAALGNTGSPAPVDLVEAPQPAPVVVEPVAPVAPVAAAPTAADDSWELKYKVLNGKYQAEVPRLARELRELREQMQAAPKPVAATTGTEDLTPASVKERYGDDFADAVAAIAADAASKVRDELSTQVKGIEEDGAARRHAEYLGELGRLVGNWQAIDADPAFTAYLDEVDTQTGRTRREFFHEADKSCNAARVASFFSAFSRGNTPAPKPVVVPAAAPSVEHLLSPDSSRSSEAPPGKKLWSRAEVAKFYADARASNGTPFGRFTAKQYEQLNNDIDAAIAEGRYTG